MEKLVPFMNKKLWGYELSVHSPLPNAQTKTESGVPTTCGLVVKIIQANDRLSVQVHPDAEQARKLEGALFGKDESWYVIKTDAPDATMVLGLKNYDQDFIRKALAEGTFEDNLVVRNVKAGDFYDIKAGQVHAIGAHIKVLEVATPLDVTYRYYDYNRLENGKPRELHVEKALACQKDVSWKLEPISKEPLVYMNGYSVQVYAEAPVTLERDAIVVDLVNDQGYLAKAGETVAPAARFAVISELRPSAA